MNGNRRTPTVLQQIERLAPAGGDDDRAAAPGERQRGGTADAARRPGDDHYRVSRRARHADYLGKAHAGDGDRCTASAATLAIAAAGYDVDLTLLLSLWLGAFPAAVLAPYAVRVLPNRVWRYVSRPCHRHRRRGARQAVTIRPPVSWRRRPRSPVLRTADTRPSASGSPRDECRPRRRIPARLRATCPGTRSSRRGVRTAASRRARSPGRGVRTPSLWPASAPVALSAPGGRRG